MSGGVDSAVAALLCARRGETVAVTLELWADPENDAERSCCSASAVAQARGRSRTQMGLPHFTIDLRDEFRAGVVDPFMAGFSGARPPTHASAATATSGSTRCSSSPMPRLRGLATGHYARIAEQDRERAVVRAAADPPRIRPTCSRRCPRTRSSAAVPARRADQARRTPDRWRAELPVAASSTRRTSASSPARPRSLPRPPRRDSARAGARSSIARPVLGDHRGQHRFTVGQRRGLGVAATVPLYVLDKDASTQSRARRARAARCAEARRRSETPRSTVPVRASIGSSSLPLGGACARLSGEPPAGPHRPLTIELDHACRRCRARPARVPDGRRARRRLGDDRARIACATRTGAPRCRRRYARTP